jgi:hypothetical protein
VFLRRTVEGAELDVPVLSKIPELHGAVVGVIVELQDHVFKVESVYEVEEEVSQPIPTLFSL